MKIEDLPFNGDSTPAFLCKDEACRQVKKVRVLVYFWFWILAKMETMQIIADVF